MLVPAYTNAKMHVLDFKRPQDNTADTKKFTDIAAAHKEESINQVHNILKQ